MGGEVNDRHNSVEFKSHPFTGYWIELECRSKTVDSILQIRLGCHAGTYVVADQFLGALNGGVNASKPRRTVPLYAALSLCSLALARERVSLRSGVTSVRSPFPPRT